MRVVYGAVVGAERDVKVVVFVLLDDFGFGTSPPNIIAFVCPRRNRPVSCSSGAEAQLNSEAGPGPGTAGARRRILAYAGRAGPCVVGLSPRVDGLFLLPPLPLPCPQLLPLASICTSSQYTHNSVTATTSNTKMSAPDNEELIDYEDEHEVTNGAAVPAAGNGAAAAAAAPAAEGDADKKNFSGIHSTGFRCVARDVDVWPPN